MERLTINQLALVYGCDALADVSGLTVPQRIVIDADALSTPGQKMFSNLRPILRHVSDITNEELREIAEIVKNKIHPRRDIDGDFKKEQVFDKDKISFQSWTGFCWINYFIENKESSEQFFVDHKNSDMFLYAEVVQYMLSKHFDIYNWIKDGLALDKNKI